MKLPDYSCCVNCSRFAYLSPLVREITGLEDEFHCLRNLWRAETSTDFFFAERKCQKFSKTEEKYSKVDIYDKIWPHLNKTLIKRQKFSGSGENFSKPLQTLKRKNIGHFSKPLQKLIRIKQTDVKQEVKLIRKTNNKSNQLLKRKTNEQISKRKRRNETGLDLWF